MLRSIIVASVAVAGLAACAATEDASAEEPPLVLPDICLEAFAAADTVASAIEAEHATASAAVTAAQKALADTEYRRRAHECLVMTREVAE